MSGYRDFASRACLLQSSVSHQACAYHRRMCCEWLVNTGLPVTLCWSLTIRDLPCSSILQVSGAWEGRRQISGFRFLCHCFKCTKKRSIMVQLVAHRKNELCATPSRSTASSRDALSYSANPLAGHQSGHLCALPNNIARMLLLINVHRWRCTILTIPWLCITKPVDGAMETPVWLRLSWIMRISCSNVMASR